MSVTSERVSEAAPVGPRRSVAPRWVLLGLALSFVVALAVAAYLYRRYMAFDRLAARHLVPTADLAVRMDLEKVTLYAPFRERLLPLLLQNPPDAQLKPRLVRLELRTGIELGVDIREIVFSRSAGGAHWAVVITGMFPKQGVVAGVHGLLEEEGLESSLDEEHARLSFGRGRFMQQAEDGAIVTASDLPTLFGALAPSDQYQRLDLGLQEPSLSVALRGAALEALSRGAGPLPQPLAFNAGLRSDAPDRVSMTLGITPGSAGTVGLSGVVGARLASFLGLPNQAVRFEVSGPNRLDAAVEVEPTALENAATRFAQVLGDNVFSAEGSSAAPPGNRSSAP